MHGSSRGILLCWIDGINQQLPARSPRPPYPPRLYMQKFALPAAAALAYDQAAILLYGAMAAANFGATAAMTAPLQLGPAVYAHLVQLRAEQRLHKATGESAPSEQPGERQEHAPKLQLPGMCSVPDAEAGHELSSHAALISPSSSLTPVHTPHSHHAAPLIAHPQLADLACHAGVKRPREARSSPAAAGVAAPLSAAALAAGVAAQQPESRVVLSLLAGQHSALTAANRMSLSQLVHQAQLARRNTDLLTALLEKQGDDRAGDAAAAAAAGGQATAAADSRPAAREALQPGRLLLRLPPAWAGRQAWGAGDPLLSGSSGSSFDQAWEGQAPPQAAANCTTPKSASVLTAASDDLPSHWSAPALPRSDGSSSCGGLCTRSAGSSRSLSGACDDDFGGHLASLLAMDGLTADHFLAGALLGGKSGAV